MKINTLKYIYHIFIPECKNDMDCGYRRQCYCNRCEDVEIGQSTRKFPILSTRDKIRNFLIECITKIFPYKSNISNSYRYSNAKWNKPVKYEF